MKLKSLYEKDWGVPSVSIVDEYLFKAAAQGVRELEVDEDEFITVLKYASGNPHFYTYTVPDGSEPYHSVLGMKLIIT